MFHSGIANIYRTLGPGNMAHINRFFCVPQAQFLGVTPQDIIDFKLQDATHKLQDVDVKRAKDALKNDPFFQATSRGRRPWSRCSRWACERSSKRSRSGD